MLKKISSTALFSVLLGVSLLLIKSSQVEAAGDGFWHTQGSRIVDSNNQPVVINGVSWFGLETASFAPHGLWSRGYKEMLDQVKNLGYNTIRLPFSNQALDPSSKPNGIDYSKNPDLQNLNALETMDKIIEYAGKIGLKVMLDQHRPDSNAQSALWYTDAYPESRWLSDWQMLAKRYANNPTVIAADIHNEPHDNACWGCGDPKVDWKQAAEKAGNAILAINPNLLIVVEGVQSYNNQYYWWGGNLSGVKDNPVRLNVANRVVYSPHDYPSSVSSQPWFSDGSYPNNLNALWDNTWGYIAKNNIAPVVLGEFGTKLETDSDKKWFDAITSYVKQNNISWVFWSLNPNSGDTGGILKDDWITVNQDKQQKLSALEGQSYQYTPSVPISDSIPADPAPIPAPAPTPSPSPASSPTPVSIPVEETMSVWWPVNGAVVSGIQPFKALLNNKSVGDYTMYWQVDNGQLNQMDNNNTDYPHKEASVDLSGWKWNSNHQYNVAFVAKDRNGNTVSQTNVVITIP